MTSIVRDPKIRSGDPRIEGTRITVLDIRRRVVDDDEDPSAVASEYDLEIAAVFEALAYFHEHVEEMYTRATEREQPHQELRQHWPPPAPEDLSLTHIFRRELYTSNSA